MIVAVERRAVHRVGGVCAAAATDHVTLVAGLVAGRRANKQTIMAVLMSAPSDLHAKQINTFLPVPTLNA